LKTPALSASASVARIVMEQSMQVNKSPRRVAFFTAAYKEMVAARAFFAKDSST
jgi:hypothetical protein